MQKLPPQWKNLVRFPQEKKPLMIFLWYLMLHGQRHSFLGFNSSWILSLLTYSLVDVCVYVMRCRGTPSPGSHVRLWRRRMTLRRDQEGRLEDSLTGNLWPASEQPRRPPNTERFGNCREEAAQASLVVIYACGKKRMKDFKLRLNNDIKRGGAAIWICFIFSTPPS